MVCGRSGAKASLADIDTQLQTLSLDTESKFAQLSGQVDELRSECGGQVDSIKEFTIKVPTKTLQTDLLNSIVSQTESSIHTELRAISKDLCELWAKVNGNAVSQSTTSRRCS